MASHLVELVAAATLLPACFHPSYDRPTCGPGRACPSGLACSAELICEGVGSGNDVGLDASLDASRPIRTERASCRDSSRRTRPKATACTWSISMVRAQARRRQCGAT